VANCRSAAIDRSRILWYLRRYALGTNPKYGRVGGGVLGLFGSDDCTNFISQALHFGGWPETNTWNFSSRPACAIDPFTGIGGCSGTYRDPSLAWDNVRAFVTFATESGRAALTSRSGLQTGDLVVADWNGSKGGFTFDHMMAITGLKGSQVYIASHTTDHLDFPLYDSPGTADSIVRENGRQPTFKFVHIR
jgi:hypothetical protein